MEPALQLVKIGRLMADNRIQLLLALQHDPRNPASSIHDHPISAHTDRVARNIAEIDQLWRQFRARHLDERVAPLADRYAEQRKTLVNSGLIPTRDAILAGKYDDATRLTLQAINPGFEAADASRQELFQSMVDAAKDWNERAKQRYVLIRNLTVAGIAGSVLFALLVAFFIIRGITRS
ncbi:MAG: Tar ligand binding domain-containing protein, partial [Sulfurimicrobium sp.]